METTVGTELEKRSYFGVGLVIGGALFGILFWPALNKRRFTQLLIAIPCKRLQPPRLNEHDTPEAAVLLDVAFGDYLREL
jgi:hypothetical protein